MRFVRAIVCCFISFGVVSGFVSAAHAVTLMAVYQQLDRETNQALKDKLFILLSKTHRRSLDYKTAREVVMGRLDLHEEGGRYFIWDVYCQKPFPGRPNRVPNEKMLNIEHTWPQSQFSKQFREETQKSDLHHLFPSDSLINQKRGHHKFGDVVKPVERLKCTESHLGVDVNRNLRFEVPDAHKGNAARAIFYFAVRYKMSIDLDEEMALRQWNHQDPVDAEEIKRTEEIAKIQGNRNPFVDHPEWVEQIQDF